MGPDNRNVCHGWFKKAVVHRVDAEARGNLWGANVTESLFDQEKPGATASFCTAPRLIQFRYAGLLLQIFQDFRNSNVT